MAPGDGMTHAVRIKDGNASYANRYVDTHRLQAEKAAGFPLYEKVRFRGSSAYARRMRMIDMPRKKCSPCRAA